MIVKCNTRCWDSKTCKRYYPGDQDNIDPLDPIAAYFDFPPGTEVYHKVKAKGRVGENIITTRIIPGLMKMEDGDKVQIEGIKVHEEINGTYVKEPEHKRPGRPPKKDVEAEIDIS